MPTESSSTVRAFVALDLDAVSVRRVARVADRLRMGSGAPSATWTPTPKLHLTLKFMAALARDAVGPVSEAIGRLATGKKAPLLGAFRLDALPSLESAEVVVALLDDPTGDVAKLAAKVEAIVAKHGVDRETRAFRPHVTLARLKMPYDVRRWVRPELAPGTDTCQVARLTLVESRLTEQGSTYAPLATFLYET